MYIYIFYAINAIYRCVVALAAAYFTRCLLMVLCMLYVYMFVLDTQSQL